MKERSKTTDPSRSSAVHPYENGRDAESSHDDSNLETLVARFNAGDRSAFDELYARAKNKLLRRTQVLWLSFPQTEVECEISRVLLNAAQAYAPDRGPFIHYAQRCLHNALVKALKRNARDYSMTSTAADAVDLLEDPTSLEDPIIEQDLFDRYLPIVRGITSEMEYAVFELYLCGDEPRETAKRLGKTEKQVRNALTRVKNKIAENRGLFEKI